MIESEKYSKFIAAITKEVHERRESIEKQAREYVEEQLEKAEAELKDETERLIKRRAVTIREETGRELSGRELENRRELFACRDKIMAGVFDKAKTKITEFTVSDGYKAFLRDSSEKMRGKLPPGTQSLTVYMRKNDLIYKDAVEKTFKIPCAFEEDAEIALGGLRISAPPLLFDDTLDTRLSDQLPWFYENSGLTIY
ncbi:MAG: V-type ATP synthase subunit E family protein [Oscillospiraceae bacterium]|nr:V-type ATP synthase subunit E family protein [Oscillospiraceae bacterium]